MTAGIASLCSLSREKSAEVIFEDENTLALLDIFPSAPGHTLIIPKKHYVNITQLSSEELKCLFSSVSKLVTILGRVFDTVSFTIGINQGEISGVPHLHVHIIPRFAGDGGGIVQGVVNNKPKESLKEIGEKIRKEIYE
ncbi:MAG: Hit-like protein [Candidatus Gottesmanbacteria bacterium GW2011_GWA2_41_12]|uniref:Hit-like protein n=2 Tax=Candidatus Gottesmaniibacteriota TaxID=1752720 RepID=A0A0G0WV46_9BACT|nr:MAG: Hit-like protein [Candidatus Gottesmanbacteria bacterium GW2011_GWC2_39_8]KKR88320.1 MAG: Hit-like protein [Candidatus Gottesmanbacteria bacterium GW2011_GWA2_41_12]